MSPKKTILVLNPISGRGHFDSWNTLVVSCLLKAGWQVTSVTPNVSKLKSTLSPALVKSPYLRVLRLRMPIAFYMRPRQLLQFIKNFTRPVRHKIGLRRRALPTMVRHQSSGAPPEYFALQTRAAVLRSGSQPDLVFNLYLDGYARDFDSWQEYAKVSSLSWAGLRISPSEKPDEGWNQLGSHRGTLYLDSELSKEHQRVCPYKVFSWLPDIANQALPEALLPITASILKKARKRKIVFLGGTIGGQKNLPRWFELIARADHRDWFFVQIGEIISIALGSEERVRLDEILTEPPENLFIMDRYLPDEAAFNQIISVSDTIFAVYRDFRNSSNMPAKAAAFSVPILVSNRYLMGRLVEKYHIGRAVDEDDVEAIYDGLLALRDQPPTYQDYAKFNADHNEERFGMALSEFLSRCCDYV